MTAVLDVLCADRQLGSFLEGVRCRYGGYELLEHWSQGEFHHDIVLQLPLVAANDSLGAVIVVSTNCNGGIKEVLCFDEKPDRWALWHHRCPENPEFAGNIPAIRALLRTEHWFEPAELLDENAPSELKPEWRERARGGGWAQKS
jgi:hypothetical protein